MYIDVLWRWTRVRMAGTCAGLARSQTKIITVTTTEDSQENIHLLWLEIEGHLQLVIVTRIHGGLNYTCTFRVVRMRASNPNTSATSQKGLRKG